VKKFVFTCEHGGNLIPDEFSELFKNDTTLLNSHRGYDIGILDVFKLFVSHFNSPTYYTEISRLLIEYNRSHHKNLFSNISKQLDENIKQSLISNYYLPYRENISSTINNLIKNNYKVIHIAFHSFTPKLNDNIRNTDIGFLYNPKSINEKLFCKEWKRSILEASTGIIVRFNYPYLGIADGLTSHIRKIFGYNNYIGIELELNQSLLTSKNGIKNITNLLLRTFIQINDE